MTSWLSTEVAGDPDDCRRAAAELHDLADTLTAAADLATHHAGLPVTELDGVAGRAFRDRAARLGERCRSARRRAERLGVGLDALADQLAGCRLAMGAARDRAGSLLVVTPTTIQPPVLGPIVPAAQDAWQVAVGAVAAVRRREAAAQVEWHGLLTDPDPDRSAEPGAPGASPFRRPPATTPPAPAAPATTAADRSASDPGPGASAPLQHGAHHGAPQGPRHPAPQALVVEPVPSGPQIAVVTEPVGQDGHPTPLLPDPWSHPWPGGLPDIDEITVTEAIVEPWPLAPGWSRG